MTFDQSQFDSFFDIQFGTSQTPETTALKFILSDFVQRFLAFADVEPSQEPDDRPGLYRISYRQGIFRDKSPSFSNCWYIEIDTKAKTYTNVSWDGSREPRDYEYAVGSYVDKDGKYCFSFDDPTFCLVDKEGRIIK